MTCAANMQRVSYVAHYEKYVDSEWLLRMRRLRLCPNVTSLYHPLDLLVSLEFHPGSLEANGVGFPRP